MGRKNKSKATRPLDSGFNVSGNYGDPAARLRQAVIDGHAEVVEEILRGTVDIAVPDQKGLTVLHLSARFGHEEIVRLLVKRQADMTDRDQDGLTALHYAARFGHKKVVRLLLQKKADTTATDKYGLTVLHYTKRYRHEPVVMMFVNKRADMAAKSKNESRSLTLVVEDSSEAEVVPVPKAKKTDMEAGENSIWTEALKSNEDFEKGDVAKLCPTCRGMVSAMPLSGTRDAKHHKTIRSLYNAVKSGCHICRLFSSRLISDYEVDAKKISWETPFSWYMSYKESDPRHYRVTLFLESEFKDKIGCTSGYTRTFIFEPVTEIKKELISSLPDAIDTFTGSSSCWSQAMKWYKECISTQTTCNANALKGQQWYPTRLLDVGTLPSSPVKLCKTSSDNTTGPYVTLSHCWGTSQMYKLTRSNITALSNEIPLRKLPRTFVDAIEITRRLGIRYIWIDSLCIIQDSTEDRLNEVALMESVYSNSHCNIAATASRNGQGGLFRSRDPAHIRAWYLTASWGQRRASETFLVYDGEMWELQLNKAPLNLRAWVLQERFLAPRVLQFCQSQIFWECRQRDVCEAFPCGLTPWLSSPYKTRFKRLDEMASLGSEASAQNKSLSLEQAAYYFIWGRLVKHYSMCEMSMAEDKLVAISG